MSSVFKMPNAAKPDPVRIPNENDPDVIDARRKKMQAELENRDGRQSTVLAGNSPGYARTTLG